MTSTIMNGVELYHEVIGSGARLVLTHGSWTDGSGWGPAVDALAAHGALDGAYEVVTWDRRGHSRSTGGDHPGSRDEDARDLAGLIETLGGGPVHLVGSSYGSIVVLSVVASRPELVASAMVHEPPVLRLPGSEAARSARSATEPDPRRVLELIEAGAHRAAAEHFIDRVALGRGSWERLPEAFRSILVANAPTYLDELKDPTSTSVDLSALGTNAVPVLLTHGTTSPWWFEAIVTDLARLVPKAGVAVIEGAGHVPHLSHPDRWAATMLDFHDAVRSKQRAAVRPRRMAQVTMR